MAVRRGGKTGISPLEIGTKNQKFLENLKLAPKFWSIHLILVMTVYLPVWHFFFRLSEFFFYPLLGRTRSRGRCWAAIQLSHRPEPSGHAVHGKVDGLDIGGQHGRRFVLLCHTHWPQRRPYPICTGRNGNVRHRCGGG